MKAADRTPADRRERRMRLVSAIVTLLAAPLAVWTGIWINGASLDTAYPYAGIGVFITLCCCVFSLATGVAGLITAARPSRLLPRILGWVQLAAAAVAAVMGWPYCVFSTVPFIILTIVFLCVAKRRNDLPASGKEI